ncbi:hypothetical protein ONS95_001214 [Cadophora gregata]|uniref:uncharacterized protein n=1 Tax=Cadophora gregata TaxID=51156 RepID=UPI0026DBC7AA|nr:uncharacterized protein ONS95_001214 [Cadophora gregata]KAK0101981.1 hypothetical protein ONS96_005949 [Cadophora gregata f. sp. sojae]KAK0129279.1 hypothetical protein ONS95_001214 [Cadophora gregata]
MIWEYFGNLELMFSDPRFHDLAAVFTYSGEAFADRRFKGLHQFIVMDHMRRERRNSGILFRGIPLVAILRRTSTFHSTVPVDKIFAVLACVERFETELKELIDYTAPLKTTLLRVARHQLHHGKQLESLSYAGIGWLRDDLPINTKERVETPSWVVDWSLPRWEAGTVSISPQRGTPYRAGTSKRAMISGHETVKDEEEEFVTKVKIRGQVLDRFQCLTSVCDSNQESDDAASILIALPKQMSWFQEVEDFIATHLSSITQGEGQEIMWRVLVGDRVPNTRPAPPSYGKHFQMMRTSLLGLQAFVEEHGPEDLPKLMQAIRDHGPFGEVFTPGEFGDVTRDMIRGDALWESPAFPRRIAVTQEMGCLGMVPKETRAGDLLVLFWGAQAPFVLRERFSVDGAKEYQIVGECYVHGVMDGEGVGKYEEQDFVIS